ncbi:CBS domain-containing protein [Actinoplanes flavus]|uniref:CBS domain-containing protein n=1 Tax=Actinoplanes flavus TaxID=2820290 RepID=A0ABS3UN70_9ACTN|nr:CBS domain-containing protein [Actinoplanes flavus]MBO3740234.1 CBS domain-containing protein [Actinoplanes flavus]
MRTWNVGDVMTQAVVSVGEETSYRGVVDVLVSHRFSAVPVVDGSHRVVGVVSEADLLRKIEYADAEKPRMFESRRRRGERDKAHGTTAGELMSAPAVLATARMAVTAAARLMNTEGVKRLPVVDDLGRLIGIVSRGDLLKVHLRPDDEILADIEKTVLEPFLAEDARAVTTQVVDGVVTLTGKVERRSSAEIAIRLARQVAGVVEVHSWLDHDFDDREFRGPRQPFGADSPGPRPPFGPESSAGR